MKKAAVVVVGLVALTSSARGEAETRYLTSWFFRVDYPASGQFSESTDSAASGAVMMPTGSNWSCKREPASITSKGNVLAGFSCWSASGYVNVQALCPATEAGEDRSTVGIGNAGASSVILVAKCRTYPAATAPAPARPDKSL